MTTSIRVTVILQQKSKNLNIRSWVVSSRKANWLEQWQSHDLERGGLWVVRPTGGSREKAGGMLPTRQRMMPLSSYAIYQTSAKSDFLAVSCTKRHLVAGLWQDPHPLEAAYCILSDRLSRIIKTWKRKEREGVQEDRNEVGCGMDEDGRWTGIGRKRTCGQRKGESSPNMIGWIRQCAGQATIGVQGLTSPW